jgi:hypothetical protein
MRRARRREAGLSLLEAVLVAALLALISAGIGGVVSATGGLANRSHVGLSANQTNRRTLETLSDVIRPAATSTLSGFDAHGVAVAPQFQAVTGTTGGARQLGPVTRVEWRAIAPVHGVTNPGELVVVRGAQTNRVPGCVPAGGFNVTLAGAALHIHVETAAVTAAGDTTLVSGDTSVTLRN